MASYKPVAPFNVPMRLMVPTETNVKGVIKKTFPEPDDCPLFYGSFRTFGGSEGFTNDIYTVIDTGTIDTWYRPDIKADCRVYIVPTGDIYEVIGSPENLYMRNQYLQFRVKKIGGGA